MLLHSVGVCGRGWVQESMRRGYMAVTLGPEIVIFHQRTGHKAGSSAELSSFSRSKVPLTRGRPCRTPRVTRQERQITLLFVHGRTIRFEQTIQNITASFSSSMCPETLIVHRKNSDVSFFKFPPKVGAKNKSCTERHAIAIMVVIWLRSHASTLGSSNTARHRHVSMWRESR